MGSGKSTHGRKLATALHRKYIDLDDYIVRKLNCPIAQIFKEFGESYFREQEKLALQEILVKETEPVVISLGGGTICFNNALELVLQNGLLIYLQTNEHALRRRLVDSKNQRPLLMGKNEEEILDYIKEKIKERSVYYTQAHITVNGLDLTTQKLLNAIEEFEEQRN